ncbi:MBL fold metallo-hydrolase [Salinigranum sp.]|uniref:MBL fold metallo-hydrolase n=1 Tax=Salinigranum sp. TaxID=1966351 RepID=UPI003567B743
MRVTFLGTGSAMPTPERVQTGLLVESDPVAGDGENGDADDESDEGRRRRLLLDCGSGVLNRLSATDTGYESVSTVLLTHHHLDHVADLLPLLKARWLAGEEHLEVVGPVGTKALVDGLLDVHDYLDGRVALRVREVGAESFSVAGFDVEGLETRHSMPCLAYRFGDEFVFSGDSEAFPGLVNFASGAKMLAHDCSFPDEVDVSNHPTPTQLGEALSGADVGRVYLTHLYPHTRGKHSEMIQRVEQYFDGDVRMASDGLRVDI